jgi:hypothetical protein
MWNFSIDLKILRIRLIPDYFKNLPKLIYWQPIEIGVIARY